MILEGEKSKQIVIKAPRREKMLAWKEGISLWRPSEGFLKRGGGKEKQGFASVEFRTRIFKAISII